MLCRLQKVAAGFGWGIATTTDMVLINLEHLQYKQVTQSLTTHLSSQISTQERDMTLYSLA